MSPPKRGMWKGFDEYPSATHPEFNQQEAWLAKEMNPTDANMYGYRDRFLNAPGMTAEQVGQVPLEGTVDKFYKLYGREDAMRVLDELNRMAEQGGYDSYDMQNDAQNGATEMQRYAGRRALDGPQGAGPDPYQQRGFPDYLPDVEKPNKNALTRLLLGKGK